MPKNRIEETIFTIMMVFVMVYAMICYNIAMSTGGVENYIFKAALAELPMMMVIAFLLDTFIAGPLAKRQAFKIVTPGESKPIWMILAISVFSVLFMCPLMSLVATILFKGGLGADTFAAWIETTAVNFPMAFFWQLLIAGPVVRWLFGRIFRRKGNM